MTTAQIEQRLAALEGEVARLHRKVDDGAGGRGNRTEDVRPWWDRIWGKFSDDPLYEEAMRLGREYRESLRPAVPKRATTPTKRRKRA